MPNFIPKKDRRFPIGALFLIAYIVIGCIGETVKWNNLLLDYDAFHYDNWIEYFTIFDILTFFILGFIYLLGRVMFVAIIIMLFIKVRHFTYAIPGAVGLSANVIHFGIYILLLIVNLAAFFNLGGRFDELTGVTVSDLCTCGLTSVIDFFDITGWISFILLAIFSTRKKAKSVNWTLIFVFCSSLIFVGGIFVNAIELHYTFVRAAVMLVDHGIEMFKYTSFLHFLRIVDVTDLDLVVGAGLSVVARIFGLVGMLLTGAWIKNPAKRGYIPTPPAEATCENEQTASAKRTYLKNLVDFYNE